MTYFLLFLDNVPNVAEMMPVPTKEGIFECPDCFYSLETAEELFDHIKLDHLCPAQMVTNPINGPMRTSYLPYHTSTHSTTHHQQHIYTNQTFDFDKNFHHTDIPTYTDLDAQILTPVDPNLIKRYVIKRLRNIFYYGIKQLRNLFC